MSVTFKVIFVPDMYGDRVCTDCRGDGWIYGDHCLDDQFAQAECRNCKGNGHFREETKLMPANGGQTLHSYDLSRDPFGRHVHVACNGRGVRFFQRLHNFYWSCTSCRTQGLLTPYEWEAAHSHGYTGFNLLANAHGANQLLELNAAIKLKKASRPPLNQIGFKA